MYTRRPRGVVECVANFSHEVGQIRLGDERGRPQTFLEHRLGEDLRSIEREYGEQVERLGREMNLPTAARHLPGVEVENERAEDDPHNQWPLMLLPAEFDEVSLSTCEFPGSVLRLPFPLDVAVTTPAGGSQTVVGQHSCRGRIRIATP